MLPAERFEGVEVFSNLCELCIEHDPWRSDLELLNWGHCEHILTLEETKHENETTSGGVAYARGDQTRVSGPVEQGFATRWAAKAHIFAMEQNLTM